MRTESLLLYWFLFICLWGFLTIGYCRLRGSGDAIRDTGMPLTLGVLGIALTARLIFVTGSSPVLSDDIWRYIHDGATLGQGVNPYLHAPIDLPPDQQPVPQVVDRINNAELVTIYQPASQYVFAGLDRLWAVAPDLIQRWDPDHDKVFRLGFVAFDMLLIVVILACLRDAGRNPWWAVAYAWHPLAISEVAGSGHQDVIGIAFLVTALWLASRLLNADQEMTLNRKRLALALGAGIAFGLSVAVKPLVLPIALPLAWMLRKRPGLIAAAAGATIATVAALYTPFLLMDGGLAGMLETGRTFVDKWAFNGSVYNLFETCIAGKPWVDRFAMLTLLAVLIVVTLREKHNLARPAGAFLFASLLLSSTVHPWYLLWALALTPLWFSPAFWVFSLTVAYAYFAHINPDGYKAPTAIVILEYLPVYAILIWQLVKWWRNHPRLAGELARPI